MFKGTIFKDGFKCLEHERFYKIRISRNFTTSLDIVKCVIEILIFGCHITLFNFVKFFNIRKHLKENVE